MRIEVLEPDGRNTGKLKNRPGSIKDWLVIKKGRYIHQDTSHPLMSGEESYFKRIYAFETNKKHVYYLSLFGNKESQNGLHIALNRWQHQKFLWLQGKNWFQKEENIRYIVNIIFLAIGVYISFKKIK